MLLKSGNLVFYSNMDLNIAVCSNIKAILMIATPNLILRGRLFLGAVGSM